ncbi:hypothetical protein D3C81_1754330 [compost metagenome]
MLPPAWLLTLMVLPPAVLLPSTMPAAARLKPPLMVGSIVPWLFTVMPLPDSVTAVPPSTGGTLSTAPVAMFRVTPLAVLERLFWSVAPSQVITAPAVVQAANADPLAKVAVNASASRCAFRPGRCRPADLPPPVGFWVISEATCITPRARLKTRR